MEFFCTAFLSSIIIKLQKIFVVLSYLCQISFEPPNTTWPVKKVFFPKMSNMISYPTPLNIVYNTRFDFTDKKVYYAISDKSRSVKHPFFSLKTKKLKCYQERNHLLLRCYQDWYFAWPANGLLHYSNECNP